MSKSRRRSERPLWHPVNWPIWALYPLLRLLAFLPPHWLRRITGPLTAWLLPKFSRRMQHITEVNLRLCLPELSATERDRLQTDHFRALGEGIAEAITAWWGPECYLKDKLHQENHELILQTLKLGKGVILLAGHFTTTEILGRLYHQHYPLSAVYQPVKHKALEYLVAKGRRRYVKHLIPSHDVRGILRALADNNVVWFAPDQNKPKKRRVMAPFFGEMAVGTTMISRLHQLTEAPIIIACYARLPNGQYMSKAIPAPPGFPCGDEEQDAAWYHRELEALIRHHPEQYLWGYKFFNHRPDGAEPVYLSNQALKKR